MQISVTKPDFTADFKARIARANAKGCTAKIVVDDTSVFVQVMASGRLVGKFVFEKDEDNCILQKFHIIEREFCPLEFTIATLAKALKRKKIKFIVWM